MLVIPTPIFQTIYRLAIHYSIYRLIIALSLTFIFMFTQGQLGNYYQQPTLYFYTAVFYALISLFQLVSLKFLPFSTQRQLVLILACDVLMLSILTFAVGSPSLHISLLFVITIFSASLLLDQRKALIITLIAVISVVYQHFVGSVLDFSSLNNVGHNALLAFLFFVVYGLSQLAVQRFQILQNLHLHQSQEFHQLQNINRYILEQIEVGYLVLDATCHIVLVNPAACHLLGILPTFAHQKQPLSEVQPDLWQLLKFDHFKHGEKFQFESQFSHYTIQIQLQKLITPQQSLSLLVLQDAQKINQQVQQLKLAALGQLTASIAHEIRNPLAAITQANQLLTDSDAEQQRMLTNMIAKQANRIDVIIKDTLNMARHKGTFPERLQLKLFLTECLREDFADIQQQIHLDLPQDCSVMFDPLQLRQVLVNLIRNAIRHNRASDFIQLRVSPHEQGVWIDVIDFGSGVQKQDISRLFQPFFSTEINGTGLGLYLSRSLCEANQAKLSYVEQPQGACFRIECSTNHLNQVLQGS